MQEPEVTLNLALEHGLTEEEFNWIRERLGRTPNFSELGVFSVMWSEHCSYKNSIALLKTLPRSGGRLLVGAGEENAGLVDIGDGYAVAFKIESHNHPSAVEPYQGAATGVGGILRDIFTMGARPIAALNSLRFGSLDDARTRYLFEGVVKGIGDYGNCFGVPTVAGEVYFDESYKGNPLVNAMAVGIVNTDRVASAVAKGKGNKVMIVGSATGRDGIHGATFASEEISEKSEAKRPSVQVGDPFTEKLLLEATLEIIKNDWIVGIQDMGAAGISCSTSEMSAKGEAGMKINLDKVPLREEDMSAYEIMLSESQERMLVVAKPGHEEDVIKTFEKWDLNCEIIGEVTDDGILEIYHHGEKKAEMYAYDLVLGGGAPVYIRDTKEPEYLAKKHQYDFSKLPLPESIEDSFEKVISSPNIASKKWVYEQYDSMVRTNTIVGPGSDSAVIYVKDTNKALAVKTDCNGRYVYLNPKVGTKIAVAESARNIVCSGGIPLAITNCLNFGNPYKPEVYWMFKKAIEGMKESCEFFNTPVTGGNVSFYNESPDSAVYPTPVIGMVGLIENLDNITTSEFKKEDDLIYLLGVDYEELGGSEYLKVVHNLVEGNSPRIDLQDEKDLQELVLDLIDKKLINSAHDISEGGIITALAECCIGNEKNQIGAKVNIPVIGREDFTFFSESQSRILISVTIGNQEKFEEIPSKGFVPYQLIGKTGGNKMVVNDKYSFNLEKLSELYFNSISRKMNVTV
ncbi:MAG: phosphoribosylformylglycinamidine synthase subunit PurL [Melioribacteraceae bacterium]|nr:phosphoribosylformylglycinamidine synthase subunit PurL [Melioribacteraceae bacterium]MCF8356127.1 phosphoribosylformylglycinamidine synthase subunit PurL [Melioribacteraceae bacterium]MCF8395475.1 phosphoribosylformylglycinamidine synthase subunit PurL [Melioribacteraceae bacterium]MCF8420815.1 phosphoribosylformylglycinamidine synthase subunit PurL [Melioribacteraceae bacterium]